MALAIDSDSGVFWTSNESQASVTWSHTCSGDNRGIFVGCAVVGDVGMVTGVTYNGTALTGLWDVVRSSYNTSGWFLVNPASGAHDVVVTFATNTAGWSDQGVFALSFTGVDQSTPLNTPGTANNYSTTPSVTVSTAAGEIIVDTVIAGRALTEGSNQTKYLTSDKSVGFSSQSGADGGEMSWSQTTHHWAIGAVSIKPAAASGLSIPLVQGIYRRRRI